MKRVPIDNNRKDYPIELISYLEGAKLYDSSSSPEAKVQFIDKEEGYFLKIASAKSLKREVTLTNYFYKKGVGPKVLAFFKKEETGYMITQRVQGNDCTTATYLSEPERLCGLLAESLRFLHSLDSSNCPVMNHTLLFLQKVIGDYSEERFNKELYTTFGNFQSAQEALEEVKKNGQLLQTDTLIHGDYCLPNVILNNWKFSKFIDFDSAGVGDRHVDIYSAIWSLGFNLGTNRYSQRFCDAYGRDEIDPERLRVVAACNALW
ncbi:MAG TPA: aminoglycoside 3'-phosphotransferase [Candidatus Tetragenococcus pullicola]|nr:aminoglycoside 3'-phosphotransferase [Candidatus Tetragenococcus pullicola]